MLMSVEIWMTVGNFYKFSETKYDCDMMGYDVTR